MTTCKISTVDSNLAAKVLNKLQKLFIIIILYIHIYIYIIITIIVERVAEYKQAQGNELLSLNFSKHTVLTSHSVP